MKRIDSKHARTTQDPTVLAGEDLAITSGGGGWCPPPIRPTCVPVFVCGTPPRVC
jgi:hypothetical protein